MVGGTPSQVWGGTPSQVWPGGVHHPRSGWGGYPIPGVAREYPISGQGGTQGTPQPGLDGGGYPQSRSGWWGGTWGTPQT